MLDGVGQVLLLKDTCPELGHVYHDIRWTLGTLVQFIQRAKDELGGRGDFDALGQHRRTCGRCGSRAEPDTDVTARA